jgi:hypothetical protein
MAPPDEEPTEVGGDYPFRGGDGRLGDENGPRALDIEQTQAEPLGPSPGPPSGGRSYWPLFLTALLLVLAGAGAAYGLTRHQAADASKLTQTVFTSRVVVTAKSRPKPRSPHTLASKPKKPKVPGNVVVPGVVGFPRTQAEETLRRLGLTVNTALVPSGRPDGEVVAQHPASGGEVKKGSSIRLNVSNGESATTQPTTTTTTQPATVTVPDLTRMRLSVARRFLGERGLVANTRHVPSSLPRDRVVSQHPAPGTTLRRGDHVFVTVSSGGGG